MTATTTRTTVLWDIQQTTPTRKDPTGIYVFHNTSDGVSLAVQLEQGGLVTGALAVCSPRDNFSKRKAQEILRNRLRVRRFNGRLGLTFPLGTYQGDDFKTDVFLPLLKYVRDNAYLFLVRGETGTGPKGRVDQRQLLRNLAEELCDIRNAPESHLS